LNAAIPATRLSDGTLRFLCLLVILLHPEPPPLICIEEPELGLHPDVLPVVSDLLKEAGERTQLIITTHSADLIDELSDMPEAVLVCEKIEGATQINRLNPEELSIWLKDYSLGKLWQRGDIGGNRW
jgi:predicted ATPase